MNAPVARSGCSQAISIDAESRLFWWLRATVAWQTLRSMLLGARLRLALVALLSMIFWGSLFALFVEGFMFLDSIHAEVISLLFNAFFSSLLLMLIFSTAILLYGSMYRSREARLLMTLPTRAEALFAHKFQEAMWFSSWGFVLLGSPMLVAYGFVRGAPWTFYALLLPFMIAFVVIPTTLGGMLCMALVAWLGPLRIRMLTVAGVVGACGLAWLGWSLFRAAPADTTAAAWFEQIMLKLSVTEQRFLPSWWLSTGLIEAASGRKGSEASRAALWESSKFLALLLSHGMLLQVLAGWLARGSYRLGYSKLADGPSARRQRRLRGSGFDDLIANCGSISGRPLRLLLVKDLRLFRRDVAQWSQFVIFFGLLGLYFVNLRSFDYNHSYASMISFLNLAVAGLILSTFTTRFIFPMISLEGRRFWILGLLPVHRDQIVMSKFVFALVGAVPACCALVILSDSMLGVDWSLIAVHEFCCLVLCLGLSGIAVGLGARMPDLRESSPAKISSGFGGTLCLVVSSLYIMAVVIVAALPTHVAIAARAIGGRPVASGWIGWLGGTQGTVVSLTVVAALGIVATIVPLSLGLRAFRRLEP